MFRNHAMRRALNSYAQQINPSVISTSVTSTLNILPIIGWSVFGLAVTILNVLSEAKNICDRLSKHILKRI